jgi:hypothetical protein
MLRFKTKSFEHLLNFLIFINGYNRKLQHCFTADFLTAYAFTHLDILAELCLRNEDASPQRILHA